MMYSTDGPVQQILFGLSDPGGLGPRRWSTGLSSQDIGFWASRLNTFCRLSPTNIGNRSFVPPRAFSYFEFSDGKAVLLARFDTGEAGRNNSHALIGSAASLGRYAMHLSEWQRWYPEDPGSALPTANTDDWPLLESRWEDDVRLKEWQIRPAAISLVREVLCRPDGYFTVLVDTDPLPLLTLVRGVLDPVLSMPHRKFGWTYSTYERSDTDLEASPREQGAPRFWCVRALPPAGVTERHRVRLESIEDDQLASLAADLIADYLKDPGRYQVVMADRLYGATTVDARVTTLLGEHQPSHYRQPVPVPEIKPAVPFPASPPDRTRQPRVAQNGSKETYQLPDAREIFTKLARDQLSPEERQRLIVDLRNLWEAPDPHGIGRKLKEVDRRLRMHDWVLLLAILGMIIAFLIALLTPSRDTTTPAPVTTTIIQPAPTGIGGATGPAQPPVVPTTTHHLGGPLPRAQ